MAPVVIGFHCSHEQHPPSRLLEHVELAADAGFTAAMCSDHFNPWSVRQGHSGYAWSWLGAAMARTRTMTFGTVCAPGQRYHPAIIAQAAATLAEMYPSRFWVALGSGEALNERITGARWPSKSVRNERLQECAEVMRALWAGETVSREGHTTTVNAHLYSRPARPPLVVGAAITAETARWMGGWADALITVPGPRDAMRGVVDAFREGGGGAKPVFLQVSLAYAPTQREAEEAAYDQWRHSTLDTRALADLDTPEAFDNACRDASPDDLFGRVRCAADIERHIDWLHADLELGYARIYLHNVARDHQARFIDACGERLLPAMADASAEQSRT